MNPGSRDYARVLAYGEALSEVQALRRGSETAFRALVQRHHATLLRLAGSWAQDASAAEEIVQQTWVEVLEGLHAFEGRSSMKTWLCGICINTARARRRKDRRTVPMSSLGDGEPSAGEAAVEPTRFFPADSHWAGHWLAFPNAWPETPEDSARAAEVRGRLRVAVAALPDAQREVLVLRDVEGFSGEEVCNILGLSDTHQRVLLHRARSKLRCLLEDFFDAPRRA